MLVIFFPSYITEAKLKKQLSGEKSKTATSTDKTEKPYKPWSQMIYYVSRLPPKNEKEQIEA